MNIRLVSDFMLELQDSTPLACLDRINAYNGSIATREALLTAVNMQANGWNSMADWYRFAAAGPTVAPVTVYEPTEQEKGNWSALADHCNEADLMPRPDGQLTEAEANKLRETIPCAACGAAAGESCVFVGTSLVGRGRTPHLARVDAYDDLIKSKLPSEDKPQ